MSADSEDSSSQQRADQLPLSHPGPSSLVIEGRNSSRNSLDLEMPHQEEEAKEESVLSLRIKTLDNSEFEVQVPEEGRVLDLKQQVLLVSFFFTRNSTSLLTVSA